MYSSFFHPLSVTLKFIFPRQRRLLFNNQSSSSSMGNGVYPTVGIEPAWLDNKRSLFTLTLEPVSTMYSLDAKLVSFFDTCALKLAIYTVPVATDAVAPAGTRVSGVCSFFDKSLFDCPEFPKFKVYNVTAGFEQFLLPSFFILLTEPLAGLLMWNLTYF